MMKRYFFSDIHAATNSLPEEFRLTFFRFSSQKRSQAFLASHFPLAVMTLKVGSSIPHPRLALS